MEPGFSPLWLKPLSEYQTHCTANISGLACVDVFVFNTMSHALPPGLKAPRKPARGMSIHHSSFPPALAMSLTLPWVTAGSSADRSLLLCSCMPPSVLTSLTLRRNAALCTVASTLVVALMILALMVSILAALIGVHVGGFAFPPTSGTPRTPSFQPVLHHFSSLTRWSESRGQNMAEKLKLKLQFLFQGMMATKL